MTTNYDDLITRQQSREPITPVDGNKMSEWLNEDTRVKTSVFHVHGHYDRPETVVFSEKQYERVVYRTDAQSALLAIGQTKSLLIVGCSSDGLRDPNLGRFLDTLASYEQRNNVQRRHYRLVVESEWEEPQGRIHCLDYGETHDKLAGFLRGLKPGASKSEVIDRPANKLDGADLSRGMVEPTPAIRYYLNKLADNHAFLAMAE
jgi:ATP-dependent RNA helicase HelY